MIVFFFFESAGERTPSLLSQAEERGCSLAPPPVRGERERSSLGAGSRIPLLTLEFRDVPVPLLLISKQISEQIVHLCPDSREKCFGCVFLSNGRLLIDRVFSSLLPKLSLSRTITPITTAEADPRQTYQPNQQPTVSKTLMSAV